MPKVRLRPALTEDIPEMIGVMQFAFRDSILSRRSFPESDPEVYSYHAAWIERNLEDPTSQLIIAEAEGQQEGTDINPETTTIVAAHPIAGWARWTRRIPSPTAASPPSKVFTPEMYPRNGDGAFAARYYQANHDAARRIVGHRPHWFLSMLVVHPGFQRRGVGSTLMKVGVDGAEEEGWPVYVNSSMEGKVFYESFGCEVVGESELEGKLVGYHMLRDVAMTR